MSKSRFWILNIVGVVCALLIAGAVAFGKINARLNESVTQTQNRYQPQFNEAQQFTPYQNLAVRVAQLAQTNAVLAGLMRKHDVSVTLNVDGKSKQVP